MANPIVTEQVRRGARAIPFEPGKLFGLAFSKWFGLMPVVIVTVIVFGIPLGLLTTWLQDLITTAEAETENVLQILLRAALPFGLSTVVQQIFVGTIAFAAVQSLRGKPVPPGTAIAFAVKRIVPLLVVAVLVGLVVLGGFVCLFVPGIIFAMMYSVAAPVAICEGMTGWSALKRSADLTRGHRGTIFVSMFLVGLVIGIVGAIIGGGLGAVMGASLVTTFVGQSIIQMVSTFLGSVTSVLVAVMYFALRQRKDGVEVDDIAKVFD